MPLIGTLDLVALVVSVAAFAILMLGRRRPLRGDARALLATALALTVFRNASNCLEWLGGVGGLEPLEDYVDTLSPLMWGFFFYVVFQALRQRELRESEERHRILLASLPQRIFYKDAQSRFVLVNEKFAADLGMEPDGVVGKTDRDFYPPELAEKYRADDERVMQTREPETLVERNVVGDVERTVEVTKAPVVNDEGQTVGLFGIFTDITERKRTEDALRLTQFCLEQTADAVFWMGPDARFVYVNEAACRSLGRTRDELLAMTVHDIDPNFPPEVWAQHWQEVQERGSFVLQSHHRARDGRLFPVEVTVNYLEFEGKQYNCAFVRDVTERAASEEAMRDRERFLASIFSSIQDGLSILDKKMNILRVNPTIEQWYGHALPLVGRKCYEAYHGRTKPCEVCPSRETLREGRAGYAVVPKTGPGGRVDGWLDLYSFPLFDAASGELKGAIEYVRDITKHREAQEALRASEERFRLLMDNAFDGVNLCEFDPITGKRRLLFCNDRFAEMSGYTREELESADDLNALAPPEMSKQELEANRRCIERQEPYRGVASWLRPDGRENVYEFAAVPIKVGDKYHLIGVDRDITERRRAEEALQHKLELERLIATISSSFINVPHQKVEQEIDRALQVIGEFAGVDRAYMAMFSQGAAAARQVHEWCAEGVEPQLHRTMGVRPEGDFPWATATLRRPEGLNVSRVDDLPQEAAREREIWQRLGIKSVLTLPMVSSGESVGFVGFDSLRSERHWDEDLIVLLRIVGVIFANALERQQAEEAVRYSEERYRMIFENATDMISIHSLRDIEFLYVNPATLSTLGYSNGALIGQSALRFVHPDDKEHVDRRFRDAVMRGMGEAEFRFRKGDGSYVWLEATSKVTTDERGRPVLLFISRDITERVQRREELRALSLEDALTKVNNRRGFFHLAEQQLKVANRTGNTMLLFFLDVDGMKWINDNLGHKEGDLALIEAANVLREAFRESDIIGRVGGDEFAVLAIEASSEEADDIVARLQQRLDSRNAQSGRHYVLSLSVGITAYDPGAALPLDELMARADALMYEHKRAKQGAS